MFKESTFLNYVFEYQELGEKKKYISHLQLKTDIRHFEMKKYQMEKNPLFQSGFSKVKCKFVNFYFLNLDVIGF